MRREHPETVYRPAADAEDYEHMPNARISEWWSGRLIYCPPWTLLRKQLPHPLDSRLADIDALTEAAVCAMSQGHEHET